MNKRKRKSLTAKPLTAPTYAAASRATGYPVEWIRRACQERGCRTPGGRIDLNRVREWIEANRSKLESAKGQLSLRDQKLAEEVRKLRLRNEHEAGNLIARSWVHERIMKAGGDLHAHRVRSEQEDALKFASTNGDIPLCRSILREIWNDITRAHLALAKRFKDEPENP